MDLRRPRIHNSLKMENTIGCSSYLAGMENFENIIFKTEFPYLSFIPSGPIPPNPAELLSSPIMAAFVAQVRSQFDVVIFDTPPITVVTDTAIISQHVDGLIMVVSAGSTPRTILPHVRQSLANTMTPQIGVIVNNMPIDENAYYYVGYYK